jgi:hypothetical protein
MLRTKAHNSTPEEKVRFKKFRGILRANEARREKRVRLRISVA